MRRWMIGVTVAALAAGPVIAQDNYGGSQGRSPTIGQRFDSFRRNLLGSPEPAPTPTNIREPAPPLTQSKAVQTTRMPSPQLRRDNRRQSNRSIRSRRTSIARRMFRRARRPLRNQLRDAKDHSAMLILLSKIFRPNAR